MSRGRNRGGVGFANSIAISNSIWISLLLGALLLCAAAQPGASAEGVDRAAAPGSSSDLASAGVAYEVRWQTVDGGATFATAGDYQLRGTVGQPDVDPNHPASSGDFSHTGGFWIILPLAGEALTDFIFRDRFGE